MLITCINRETHAYERREIISATAVELLYVSTVVCASHFPRHPASFSRCNDNDAFHRCMLRFHFDQKLQYLTRGLLGHFTAAGYLPAGESIPLFLLCVHPHFEFAPHLHSPVFRSLSLPYVDSALLLLHFNDATRVVYSSFHVAARASLGYGHVKKRRKKERKKKEKKKPSLILAFYLCTLFHTLWHITSDLFFFFCTFR